MTGVQQTSFVGGEIVPTTFDLSKSVVDDTPTWSNGNRTVYAPRSGNHDEFLTVAPLSASGTSYWEITVNAQASPYYPYLGIGGGGGWASPQDIVWWYGADGSVLHRENSVTKTGATYSTFGAGDVLGFAVTWPGKTIWMRKNGVWQGGGNPSAGTGGISFTPTAWAEWYADALIVDATITLNAGNAAFHTPAPSGFEPGIGVIS